MRSPPLVLIVLALSVSSEAFAQYKDNTSPPIDVPTTPVPQGPMPPPPPPKAPPPKPAPAAAAPAAGAPATPPATPTEKTEKTEKKEGEPKYNNEGVFKISGASGTGAVTGKNTKGKPAPAAAAAKPGKTVAAAKKATAMIAQWPGFRLTDDGGSEVMVEFSQNPPSPTEHKAAGSVTYVFKGPHVIKSNNKNPLITVHFNTPIASARLVPKKGELHLIIDYRGGVDSAASSGLRASSDGDGQQFFVKFPAGTWLPKGSENDEVPTPTQKLKNKPKDEKPATSGSAPPPKADTGGAKTGPNP